MPSHDVIFGVAGVALVLGLVAWTSWRDRQRTKAIREAAPGPPGPSR